MTFSFQILNYDISNEKTKELMQKFITFHNIPKDQKERLFKHIDGYTNELAIVYNKDIENVCSKTISKTEKKDIDEDEIVIID